MEAAPSGPFLVGQVSADRPPSYMAQNDYSRPWSVAAFELCLMFHAEARSRHRVEALVADRLVTHLAAAVRACIDPAKCSLDGVELTAHGLDDRQVLLAFECLGTDVGLMLVDDRQL